MDREILTAAGIEPEYYDIWGKLHVTSDDVAQAILKSLGEPASASPDSRARKTRIPIQVHLPADRAGASMKLEIEWEGGDLQHHWFWLPELPTIGRRMATSC